MDRRQLLLGGAVAAAAATAGHESGRAGLPAPRRPAQARSARPAGRGGAVRSSVVWRVDTAADAVALTFDDGPDAHWTPRVLALLERHGAHATFFCVARRAVARPDLVEAVLAAGHEIGSHTWSHADLARASAGRVQDEVGRASAALARLTGRPPALFRPPWGHVDAEVLLAAAEAGCDVLLWSELVRGRHPEEDLRATLRDVRPGSVVLAHDGGPTPTDGELAALDALLGALAARGTAGVTASTLLAPGPGLSDGPVARQVAGA